MADGLFPGLTAESMVWVLVIVMIIEGVWLTGLTYMIWRRARDKAAAAEEEEEPEEPTTST